MDGGYSKINIIHCQNSRSMDFSDLGSKTQSESNLEIKDKLDYTSSNKQEDDEMQHQERKFGNGNGSHVVLKRNCSVSSSSSGFQTAVKGVISSMRRSSSTVSERYSRIHDQSVTCVDHHDGEEEGDWGTTTRSNRKRHNGGKILKACEVYKRTFLNSSPTQVQQNRVGIGHYDNPKQKARSNRKKKIRSYQSSEMN
ncbi:uncharacterized protein LOC133745705 [Rosa rugosa]|uniref:uncharacterized protein LOC133745705 n=1 Tax=Rosa rugosa TaxID=74645 RepID=UPI002B40B08A|nr:uncharacterized protein LOC133745705 [Rosa rugosa]